MNRLCFGGSFNPIHHGHLLCARAVAEQRGYSRVTLIPTGQSPHKTASAKVADPAIRLAMVQQAIVGDTLFDVSDIETSRSGPSYTIDTVRRMHARGDGPVHWLIGADMLLHLPHWHQPEALLAETTFIIMSRPGWVVDWNKMPHPFRKLQENVVEAPLITISSTAIRARAAAGLSLRYLTPDPVCRLIEENQLYR